MSLAKGIKLCDKYIEIGGFSCLGKIALLLMSFEFIRKKWGGADFIKID